MSRGTLRTSSRRVCTRPHQLQQHRRHHHPRAWPSRYPSRIRAASPPSSRRAPCEGLQTVPKAQLYVQYVAPLAPSSPRAPRVCLRTPPPPLKTRRTAQLLTWLAASSCSTHQPQQQWRQLRTPRDCPRMPPQSPPKTPSPSSSNAMAPTATRAVGSRSRRRGGVRLRMLALPRRCGHARARRRCATAGMIAVWPRCFLFLLFPTHEGP